MATSEKKLLKSLRTRELRKKTAVDVVRATNGTAKPKVARRVVADLASVVDELDDRLRQGPEKPSAARRTSSTFSCDIAYSRS